jgi:hypothetical protein
MSITQTPSRALRGLLQKPSKAFNSFNVQTAQQSVQLEAQSICLKELTHERRKRVAVDANETSASPGKLDGYFRAIEADRPGNYS